MNSELIVDHRSQSNDSHLAEVDLAILRELSSDARISNKDLAGRVGLAASTCSGRVSALRSRGIISGFHAQIDFEALGLHVVGMISVRMSPVGRSKMSEVIAGLLRAPETLDVFQVSGERDLLVHIATAHPTGLNAFIDEHLSDPTIAHTQTSLVFGHHRP
ncbi:Lrp/AsnC family transcriptional regulator [Brevibacterium antiquum]|uniref:Lrp/AsnC family transcriptional regulator n=1 Tax=Brevibacterium antiquum TaxID=234835 RepID=UPI001F3012BF|nr:Lrp/AsnC family transcriptional regulator [Brevibacterium antiquum]